MPGIRYRIKPGCRAKTAFGFYRFRYFPIPKSIVSYSNVDREIGEKEVFKVIGELSLTESIRISFVGYDNFVCADFFAFGKEICPIANASESFVCLPNSVASALRRTGENKIKFFADTPPRAGRKTGYRFRLSFFRGNGAIYACVTRKETVSVPPSGISGRFTVKSPPVYVKSVVFVPFISTPFVVSNTTLVVSSRSARTPFE